MTPKSVVEKPAKMPVVGTDFQFKLHRQGVILHPFRAQELLVRQSENTLAWNKRGIHWRQMGFFVSEMIPLTTKVVTG